MRATSTAFAEAVVTSHRLATQATVLTDGADVGTVPIIDGTVTLDQTAAVRGRCDLTVVDDGSLGLIPTGTGSLLAPYGNELRVERGIMYPEGTVELVSLGVYRIQDVDVDDTPDGLAIRVTGLDRAARLIEARFEEPYNVTSGTNYATAILDVLTAGWPGLTASFAETTLTTPALIAQEGDDRWEFAQRMAVAVGMRLYFDGDGTLILTPDNRGDPVAMITEGADGVLLQAARRWTREGAFNRVIATGENTGEAAPVRGVATDENPLSPTYYFGPFGQVPRFYSSPLLTTDAQAEKAAQTILDRELGTTESVTFGAVVLPHLEPGDTVRITRERSSIDEDHIVDTVNLPLTPDGVMTGQTRARQVLS